MKSEALQRIGYRSTKYLQQKMPTILTIVGVIGVAATAITAVTETPKALAIIEDMKREKRMEAFECEGEQITDVTLSKVDIVKKAGPCYIPVIVLGLSTMGCIIGANVLNRKMQASLSSALYLSNHAFMDYRNKVKELYSPEADKEIRTAIANDKFKEQNIEGIQEDDFQAPSTLLTFYDEFSGTFFQRTEQEVMDAEYHLNRNFTLRGETNMNEFYEFLGLPQSAFGDEYGWNIYAGECFYGYSWIDFEHDLTSMADGSFYYFIHMPFPPTSDYRNY